MLQAVFVDETLHLERSIWSCLAASEAGLAVREKLLRPPQHGLFFPLPIEQDNKEEMGSKLNP